jgi:Rieske Fe-S protein
MTQHRDISRRAVLAASAAGAGTIAVAACSAGNGSSASTGGQSVSAPAGATLTALSSVPVGGSTAVTLPGNAGPAIVSRPTASTVKCFTAICTHAGCTVQPNGKQLDCPCHGSVYNAFTGAVLQGPAPTALAAIPVQVVGGNVVTGPAA